MDSAQQPMDHDAVWRFLEKEEWSGIEAQTWFQAHAPRMMTADMRSVDGLASDALGVAFARFDKWAPWCEGLDLGEAEAPPGSDGMWSGDAGKRQKKQKIQVLALGRDPGDMRMFLVLSRDAVELETTGAIRRDLRVFFGKRKEGRDFLLDARAAETHLGRPALWALAEMADANVFWRKLAALREEGALREAASGAQNESQRKSMKRRV